MKVRDWVDDRVRKMRMMIKCFDSRERFAAAETVDSSESLATRDFSASGYSSRAGDPDPTLDSTNIQEAESSLRETGFLNYEEARALLGRLEYQKGNVEAALQVFQGIDIATVTPKITSSLAARRRSQADAAAPMSMNAIGLLSEAIFLKAKSLQALGRYREAAESCKIILDTVESALPDGFPGFPSHHKLQETLNKSVELLPELWKLAHDPQAAVSSYRRALLYRWNLDNETRMNVEKEFAVFLLYSGCAASPPNLRTQMESSYVPKNNIEEAILLLLILLEKFVFGVIEWDPSVYHHLSFALSVANDLTSLAHQIEEFPPGTIERKQTYSTLALCYYGGGDETVSLRLLRNSFYSFNNRDDRYNDHVFELLLASKICGEGEKSCCLEEGIGYARESLVNRKCEQMVGVANCVLGTLLSARSKRAISDSDRVSMQSEALERLKTAQKITKEGDGCVLFHLSHELAEERKLESAVYYAKWLVKMEAGASVKSWILLARILSAQKRYAEAENVVDAAIDETGKWEQGELLRTKAKLQIAQGRLRNGVETYTHLLALLQVSKNKERGLETETWHDLANVYTSLSQWRDAEVCLSKSKAINPHSASRWHSTGLLHQAKGQKEEALESFEKALGVEPHHVPSLISAAIVLREIGDESLPVAKSFVTDALRLDRMNPCAWYNLGLLHKAEGGSSTLEAVECFEAATLLEESAPIEPFR